MTPVKAIRVGEGLKNRDLLVMGGEGCGFEFQHRILDGHFSYLYVVKIVLFV